MAKQTIEKKIERINKNLVGKNIEYIVLAEPKKPAYPKGNEVRYFDDYLKKLNELYALGSVLGKHKAGIAKLNSLDIYHFTMNSPLQSTEGENILKYILINSARADSWQPMIIDVPKLTDTSIKTAKEYIENVNETGPGDKANYIDKGIIWGMSYAQRGGFALPIEHENKVIAIPTQEFIEYCVSKEI